MTGEVYELTELSPDQCACRRHRGGQVVEPDDVATVGQPFLARFDGVCEACGGPIVADRDEIVRAADTARGCVHADRCPR